MNEGNTVLYGLSKRLVDDKLLGKDAVIKADEDAAKAGISLAQYLVESAILSSYQVACVTAQEFGVPLFDLASLDIKSCPQKIVDTKLLRKHLALPLCAQANRLQLGVVDPTNHHTINEIRFQVGTTVEPIVVEYDKLKLALDTYIDDGAGGGMDEGMDGSQFDDIDLDANTSIDSGIVADADDAPIVRFVNTLLLDAIKRGASDIHFEPYEHSYRVRFRTDGILAEVSNPPANLGARLAARLKVMSRMDISERRLPQDGRIKMRVSEQRAIDFRVNSLPTQYGEKIVLRILDPANAQLGIETLGYEEDQKDAFLKSLHQAQGMILVTGPTGSGKTVSLYTGLNILNTAERNISTAEDPIELNLEGINQVQIRPRIGLDFSEALRAFLRQDPDVIMVGEIRDIETAEIAIKAAQTGHLVLSTLHTNSAPETLTRLLNMGVPAFNLATSVSLIIAQRLARRLCAACKEPATDIPKQVLADEGFGILEIPLSDIAIHRAVGCDHCDKGYKGRVGIYEVLKISPGVAKIIMAGGNSLEIADFAKTEGFRNLRQSALRKAAEGLISLEETNRVSQD